METSSYADMEVMRCRSVTPAHHRLSSASHQWVTNGNLMKRWAMKSTFYHQTPGGRVSAPGDRPHAEEYRVTSSETAATTSIFFSFCVKICYYLVHSLVTNIWVDVSVLLQDCNLQFNPTSSSSEGLYAVQVVMSDYPSQTITLTHSDGSQEVKTNSKAISKIPIQFGLRGTILCSVYFG